MTQSITPPRPLKKGEFYCHTCKEFVMLKDYDEHHKKCRMVSIRKEGKSS